MNRKRNRGIAVRVLAVVSGVVLSLQVNVQPASAAYFGTCSSNIWKNWTVIERVKTSPGISGVLANVRVRPLVPCTQSGSIADQSFAPVTLQYNGTDPDRIVQIGYSRCGESGGCNGIPADGWYKAPIVGHEYRMKVESISGPSWYYCIKDVTAGEGYVCHTRSRTWGTTTGTFAWWGTCSRGCRG